MTRLEKLIAALQRSLRLQGPLRERARRRMLARHKEGAQLERRAEAAEDSAERLRGKGHVAKAERKSAKAMRLRAAAEKRHARAIVWKARARKLTKRIEGIEDDLAKAQGELRELGPQVNFTEQKVTGGTVAERWVVAGVTAWQRCAHNERRNAYSQLGRPDIWHIFGPGPAPGRRDDCSSYVTSQALACGFDDPNGNDFNGEGFTGTLVGAHGRWKEVSLAEMKKAGMGYIVYGSGSGHHTEAYCPSKTDRERTIGHGSAPVDPGTIHLFGPNEVERYFIFEPTA